MLRHLIVLGLLCSTMPVLTQENIPPAPADHGEDDDLAYVGEAPERYVQVRLIEGAAMVKKGDVEEALVRGIPLTEGDVVDSRGRGVLQLADGTRIVYGQGARFTIASLFVERQDKPQTVFRLERGHMSVQMGRHSDAQFRMETPSGRGVLASGDCASFEVDADRSVRVKVFTGRILYTNSADRVSLASGERLTIYSDQDTLNRVRDFNTFELETFDRWADAQFTVTRGPSRERLPADIRAFGDDLDEHGEWIDVEGVGWCWRPSTYKTDEDWRPYSRGRWAAYAGGMTWISDDPFGYVTHHYGRWGWTVSLGWYWIPGVYYSPAWVAFRSYDTYFGWAPLGYWNSPCTWGHRHWGGGYCWNIVDVHHIHYPRIHTHMHIRGEVFRPFNAVPQEIRGGSSRLTPPWRQTPLIVRNNELRDPNQFRSVTQNQAQASRFRQTVQAAPSRFITQRVSAPTRPQGEVRTPFTQLAPERRSVIRERPQPEVRREGPREPSLNARPGGAPASDPRQRPVLRGESSTPQPRTPEARPSEIREQPRREERPTVRPRPDTEPHRFGLSPREGEGRPFLRNPSGSEGSRPSGREMPRESPRETSRPESRPAPPPARTESRPSAPPPRSESRPSAPPPSRESAPSREAPPRRIR